MYKFFTLLFTAMLLFSCHSSGKKSELMLSAYTYDFGNIDKDTIYHGFSIIRNTGNTPLVIQGINSDCGCTNVSSTKTTIMPNDTSLMSFSFQTFNKAGIQENYISIIANTDSLIHLLQINAYVQ